jgi:hypothetical protein
MCVYMACNKKFSVQIQFQTIPFQIPESNNSIYNPQNYTLL